jgi:hypothetical protein
MTDQTWWLDPECAWWAKADCAKGHIDTLAGQVNDFLRAGSYAVIPEQGRPGETAYRLRMSRRIPVQFSTMLGDALHDLRSALDCAAGGMARRYLGKDLSEKQQHACEFPICSKPSELPGFFKREPRPSLFGPLQQQALREVQPAAPHDDLATQGRTDLHERSEEVAYDHLAVLQRLSNIDKHRRLHVVTFCQISSTGVRMAHRGVGGSGERHPSKTVRSSVICSMIQNSRSHCQSSITR